MVCVVMRTVFPNACFSTHQPPVLPPAAKEGEKPSKPAKSPPLERATRETGKATRGTRLTGKSTSVKIMVSCSVSNSQWTEVWFVSEYVGVPL